jgi:hypothetical protein
MSKLYLLGTRDRVKVRSSHPPIGHPGEGAKKIFFFVVNFDAIAWKGEIMTANG